MLWALTIVALGVLAGAFVYWLLDEK